MVLDRPTARMPSPVSCRKPNRSDAANVVVARQRAVASHQRIPKRRCSMANPILGWLRRLGEHSDHLCPAEMVVVVVVVMVLHGMLR